MSKKDNKYKNKNKSWTDEEIKNYLTEFLHGFNIQEIAAGPGATNKTNSADKQYLRQHHSVDEKLKDYMRDTLNGNLIMNPHKWGTLFFITGVNTICALSALRGLPGHITLTQASINRLYEVFKEKASECIIDLVSAPDKVTSDPTDNVYVALLDGMLFLLTDKGFIEMCSKRDGESMIEFINSYTEEGKLEMEIDEDDKGE